MDLMHNHLVIIRGEKLHGVFRVLLSNNIYKKVALFPVHPISKKIFGEEYKSQLKSKKTLIHWLDQAETNELNRQNKITFLTEPKNGNFLANYDDNPLYQKRLRGMASFLDYASLASHLLKYQSISNLVLRASKDSGLSKTTVYKLFYRLCEHGFEASSLHPVFMNCGAIGKQKLCESGRRKSGRKAIAESLSGFKQPGMTPEWQAIIIDADKHMPTPKPKWSKRYRRILMIGFAKRTAVDQGEDLIELDRGSYPNLRQVKRVLQKYYGLIESKRQSTSSHHFEMNQRGLTGKSWENVPGPGHTYAIDSTVGNIYLRSSINPEWIIGRPIIYVLVCAWSTAIVGFHVCLSGPSWDMAKLSIFNTVIQNEVLIELSGMNLDLGLSPSPTLPAFVLADRGEYLSLGAKNTAFELVISISYTPPYRGDLKGYVEVTHRIPSDEQILFVPGAFDARRKEYDKWKRSNPNDAVMTLKDFTTYLASIYREYNLHADRKHRLDSQMISENVHPSPAGLWRWGHENGIGYQKFNDESSIVTSLLKKSEATINKYGVQFNRNTYVSKNPSFDKELACIARNYTASEITVFYYPGSVSHIWIEAQDKTGLEKLTISDFSKARKNMSYEELEDVLAYEATNNVEHDHQNLAANIKFISQRDQLVNKSKKRIKIQKPNINSEKINITQARRIEIENNHISSPPNLPIDDEVIQDDVIDYIKMVALSSKKKQ